LSTAEDTRPSLAAASVYKIKPRPEVAAQRPSKDARLYHLAGCAWFEAR
jgi:hypothetical protein